MRKKLKLSTYKLSLQGTFITFIQYNLSRDCFESFSKHAYVLVSARKQMKSRTMVQIANKVDHSYFHQIREFRYN